MANSERDQIIARDLAAIRTAVFGRDVRTAIADGIEQCYSDVSNSRTIAEEASTSANNAAANANTQAQNAANAVTNANTRVTDAINNLNDIVLVQSSQPSSQVNKIWVKPVSDEYQVPTWAEFRELSDRVDNWSGGGSGSMDLPVSDGTPGQCLMTDGQGNLEWGTPTNVDVVLGDLALKDRAEARYTPSGRVSAPHITISPDMQKTYLPTSPGGGASYTAGTPAACTFPQIKMEVVNENLIVSLVAGSFTPNVPTRVTLPQFEEIDVMTGAVALSDNPVFTGNEATITAT